MCEKDNDQEKEIKETTEDSSFGCIIWPVILFEVFGIIIWIIWLIQGRPDNWYGKLYRFQWKVGAVLIILGIICAAIWGCLKFIKKKNTEADDEEKR